MIQFDEHIFQGWNHQLAQKWWISSGLHLKTLEFFPVSRFTKLLELRNLDVWGVSPKKVKTTLGMITYPPHSGTFESVIFPLWVGYVDSFGSSH